jgi:hypothetical protein
MPSGPCSKVSSNKSKTKNVKLNATKKKEILKKLEIWKGLKERV